MDTKEEGIARRRRKHSDEFKAQTIEACRTPGVSVAAVASANGLNANMLRSWIAKAGKIALPRSSLFQPLALSL
jgi:transposase-like protein